MPAVQISIPLGKVFKPLRRNADEVVLEAKNGEVIAWTLTIDSTMLAVVKAGVTQEPADTVIALSIDDVVKLSAHKDVTIEFTEAEAKIRYSTKRGAKVSKVIRAMAPGRDRIEIEFQPVGSAVVLYSVLSEVFKEAEGDAFEIEISDGKLTVLGSGEIRASKIEVPVEAVTGQAKTKVNRELLEMAIEFAGALSDVITIEVNDNGLVRIVTEYGYAFVAPTE